MYQVPISSPKAIRNANSEMHVVCYDLQTLCLVQRGGGCQASHAPRAHYRKCRAASRKWLLRSKLFGETTQKYHQKDLQILINFKNLILEIDQISRKDLSCSTNEAKTQDGFLRWYTRIWSRRRGTSNSQKALVNMQKVLQ
jgi:hypothetical protein